MHSTDSVREELRFKIITFIYIYKLIMEFHPHVYFPFLVKTPISIKHAPEKKINLCKFLWVTIKNFVTFPMMSRWGHKVDHFVPFSMNFDEK